MLVDGQFGEAVDNSLQEKVVSFSVFGMKKRIALVLVALLLGNVPALPSHAEVCEGNYCSVTFEFTGDIVQFNVPVGVSSIDFEVLGASGGRGGQGGKVTGTLTNLPQSLYVVVGSAGSIGSQVAGGYNGGGQAGGYRTNEGSGGGATDIRLDLGLDSRIVVAGGGGGAGGFSGAPGGAGGGLVAASGQSGQGSGGGGGTQSAGGAGGVSNGGTSASAGSFGAGGTGGNSTNAGGGGGGGGWYGGGGGGADDDNCCSDGGGGGGGSSYTDANYVLNEVHESGVQLGNGKVVFNYVKSLVITEFAGVQLDSATAQFNLGMSLNTPVELSQFDLSGLSCASTSLEPQGTNYVLTAIDCLDGTQTLRVAPGAIDGLQPLGEMVANVEFDATAPQFDWQPAVVDHLAATATIDFSIVDAQLSAQALIVSGCDLVEVVAGQILLTECNEETATVTLPALALSDSWGNASPEQDAVQQISFDFTVPTISFSNITTDEITAQHSFELMFSEPSTLDVTRISANTTTDCEFTVEAGPASALVAGNCGYGEISYTVLAGALTDDVGNIGPQSDLVISFTVSEPAVVVPPAVTPEPEVQPSQPEPEVIEVPIPPVSNPPTSEPPSQVSQPETPVQPVPAEEVLPTPEIEAEQPAAEEEAEALPEPAEESIEPTQADPESPAEPALTSEQVEEIEIEGEPEVSDVQAEPAESAQTQQLNAEPAAQVTEQPRLDPKSIPSDSGQLSLWLITAGGAAAVGATGYLVLRFIGK